jgi:hypothetical protein
MTDSAIANVGIQRVSLSLPMIDSPGLLFPSSSQLWLEFCSVFDPRPDEGLPIHSEKLMAPSQLSAEGFYSSDAIGPSSRLAYGIHPERH